MRPSLDEYFINIAEVIATRSTCRRHNIGAVTIKGKHILTTGYNGAPSGLKDCLELGCLRDEQNIPSGERTEICRGVHAEENTIIQAGLHGISLERATLYTTHSPCRRCAKMITNARIVRVAFKNNYNDGAFEDIFEEAGIKWSQVP